MTVDRDINKFTRQLTVAVKTSRSKRELVRVGKFIIKEITARTRRGYGVRRLGGPKRRLAKLSENYVDYRKRNRRRLSKYATPRKSNLTFSNQMLGSMKTRTARGRLSISPEGRRRGGGNNSRVAEFVSKRRPFLNLGKTELIDLVDRYEDILAKSVRRRLSRL